MALQYSIQQTSIAPALVLAPMSGVTTSSFRRLIKELNPGAVGLVITEFISVEAMTRKVPRTLSMMKYEPMERPLGIQIFGHDIARMRDAAMMCQDSGVDLVDINCGCPAPKVVRKGGGAELLRQPDHLKEIIKEVRKVLTIPLTIKIRSGWDEQSKNGVEIAKMAAGEGIDAIAVHGRTRAQLYRGMADWEFIRKIKQEISIPVLGSGDVVDTASAQERLQTGADGILIGRAAMTNPRIFSEIAEGRPRSGHIPEREAHAILMRYIELLQEEFSPKACVGKVKQLASQMCRGAKWRKELLLAPTLEAQRAVLESATQRWITTE